MPFDIDPKYTEAEVDEVGKVLLNAAEEIRKGWCQRALANSLGHVCALGAMKVADGAPREEMKIFCHQFSGIGQKAYGRLWHFVKSNVADWNNAPGRTAEEVAQAMEAAARMKE